MTHGDLAARVDALSSSLSAAWERIERLERGRPVPVQMGPNPMPECSTAVAAALLGVPRKRVERLIKRGVLAGADVRKPGARRARWAVSVASLRELVQARRELASLTRPDRDSFASPPEAGLRR